MLSHASKPQASPARPHSPSTPGCRQASVSTLISIKEHPSIMYDLLREEVKPKSYIELTATFKAPKEKDNHFRLAEAVRK